jgi:hypothetical protein
MGIGVKRLRRAGIPVADLEGLRAAIRRTTVQRAVLGVAAVCCLLAAALTALHLPSRSEVLTTQRSGVILLDMSRSINVTKMTQIRALLTHFATPTQRVGLVFFSDTAYELLPPGSPGTALKPLIRFFRLVRIAPGSRKVHLIPTPWDNTFRGGTEISKGLEVARAALLRQHLHHEPILLVSDLDAFTDDLQKIGNEISELHHEHIPLRIFPIEPTPNDRDLFTRLAGKRAFLPVSSLGHTGLRRAHPLAVPTAISGVLIGVAVALLLALGLNEIWCGRLVVPAAEPGETA